MIAWSIEAALESGMFDRVIVSTDDPKIAAVAREFGAEIPFERPVSLADDFTPTRDVINHAVGALESEGETIDELCCIYATAPFVQPVAITESRQMLDNDESIAFVFAAATFPYPAQRALIRTETGGVGMMMPEHAATRSQDLVETYHDAGQFYWGRKNAFLAGTPMFSENARPFLIDRLSVQDIDTPEDWVVAEALFRLGNSR